MIAKYVTNGEIKIQFKHIINNLRGFMSQNKAEQLATIAAEVHGCTKCALHANRIQAVPGYGDENAEIMFIGEAPGANEDKQGLPFVGRSGQYLDYLWEKIGLHRSQLFIANVVKCRPLGNRDPLLPEIQSCKPYLDQQIKIIDPLVIATLGRFSMGLYFSNAKISQIHGQEKYEGNRAYFPFYHPAAALRNPNLRHDMERDMAHLLEVVAKVKELRNNGNQEPSENDDPEDYTQLSLF